jgi:hypothetical protein
MSNVELYLDNLDKLLAEKRYWVQVLGLWAHANKAGFESDQVKAFTFRPEFLSRPEKRMKPVPNDLTHHNALRLVNGDLVCIPLIKRPEPPETIKCSVRAMP